jgi:hypothetical protein
MAAVAIDELIKRVQSRRREVNYDGRKLKEPS